MKKLLACMLAGTLALSAAACGSSSDESQGQSQVEGSVSLSEDVTSQEKQLSVEEDSGKTVEETDSDMEQESADVPDVSDAVDGQATTDTDPVPLDCWAKTTLYATQDSTYHTVYVRVTKVTTQSEDSVYVDSAIETSDQFGEEEERFDEGELDIPEDGELVVLDYEVYVPDDYPAPNYGMTEPKVYFSVKNIGGGGFPSADGSDVYVGMGSTVDLAVREAGEVYEPGNTYNERCIYAMVQGYTDYVASYSSFPDGTTSEETNEDNMYTVYHSVN